MAWWRKLSLRQKKAGVKLIEKNSRRVSQKSRQRPLPSQRQAFYANRHIRVFISSTFKDMKHERELLIKQVFPELRRICADRFVTFTEVDLRWGITEEQTAEGKVLPVCLEEIQRCRPFFIGLLGERYGWIPETVSQEVIEREPWLQEHVMERTSVTELEIIHGVLKNPEMAEHALFFFRDPGYINYIPEKDRKDYITENTADAEKLRQLKDRIRRSGMPVYENYADPKALAAAIRVHFIALIDRLYPEEELPTPLTHETIRHLSYGWNKLFCYVERPAHRLAIDSFVNAEATGQGLVVTGESGSGKTSLLASCIEHWIEKYPDDFVFVHYFGATPESTSVSGFLSRLLSELKRRFGISEKVPGEPDKLREALPLWLAQAVGKRKNILILDALNRIEGNEPDRQLSWLPHYFPDHWRVIISALPGPSLKALLDKGWAEYPLPLFCNKERLCMIQTFFEHYRKTLRTDLIMQIAEAPGSANPLFLKTVLEELRQVGSFEHLPGRVEHYLEARSPDALFRRVLRRWQEDFDAGQDMVRRSLCCLWASRQGLDETEWLEILGTDMQALPRQVWSPLFLTIEPHLSLRTGLWTFGHDFLRQAVEDEYLSSEEKRHTAHIMIADYFELQTDMNPRKVAEWPFQLHAAESWDRLEACLTNKDLFLALNNDRTKWDLTSYWIPLQTRGVSLGARLTQAFDHWLRLDPALEHNDYLRGNVAAFLHSNGCPSEAEVYFRRALEGYNRVLGKHHQNTLACLNNLAEVHLTKGDYSMAEPLFLQALAGYEQAFGENHPETLVIVNNLAELHRLKGDFSAAENLYHRALAGRERVLGKEHLTTLASVRHLATLLLSKGDYSAAESLYRQALVGRERVLGKKHPSTLMILNDLAELLRLRGNYTESKPMHNRALAGREQILGKDHPDTLMSVNNLALLLYSMGDYGSAEPLYRRALAGYERVLGKDHPTTLTIANNLALLLSSKKDYDAAESLYRQAVACNEKRLGKDHPNTLLSVSNLAALLHSRRDYNAAEPLYRRSLGDRERLLGKDHPDTLVSATNLASLLSSKGDYDAAETLYRQAMACSEKRLGKDHPVTLSIVNNLADLLHSKGDYGSAEPIYRQTLEHRERSLGENHPDTLLTLNNLAALLCSKGDYGAAELLYRRALVGLLTISRIAVQNRFRMNTRLQ
jgi:nephrocystin-3